MIILNTDRYRGSAEVCGDMGWVRSVHGDLVVSGGVVRRTGGDAEKILVCHLWKRLLKRFWNFGWIKKVPRYMGYKRCHDVVR